MCTWMDENTFLVAAWLLVTVPLLTICGFVVWAIVRISDAHRAYDYTGEQVDGDAR